MEKKLWPMLKSIPTRLVDLLIKLIAVKTVVFVVATWLAYYDKINWWAWFAIATLVVSARFFEKLLGIGGFQIPAGSQGEK